ncbi:putative ATPase YjoB [compost metagenome]
MKTNTITVTAWEYDKWGEPVAITKRAWNTVVMERGLKESLIQDIDLFYESREWYESKGLPYKRCVLFYGPPGTGKTSTIKALASYYGRNVFTLNLSTVSDNMLQRAMGSIPEGSILLIEDFDTNKTTVARAPTLVAPAPKPASGEPEPAALAEPGKPPEGFVALSLSGLLNALDGIVPLDGSLIFLTTNAIEKIDAALLRNGRVDKRILVPFLRDPEVRDYIELMFPGTQVSVDICFSPIAGCDLMSLFSDNRDDPQAFIQAIPQTTLSGLLGQALELTQRSSIKWDVSNG